MNYINKRQITRHKQDNPGKTQNYYTIVDTINLIIDQFIPSGSDISSAAFLDGHDSVNILLSFIKVQPIILKINQWKTGFEQVSFFYNQCQQLSIPVPNIIAQDLTKTKADYEVIVLEYVEHKEQVEDPLKAGREIGKVLGQLHSVSLEGYGKYQNARFLYETFGAYIEKVISSKYLESKDEIFTREQFSFLGTCVKHIKSLDSDSKLLHGDIGIANALFDKRGKLQALIDPDTLAGNPLWDIAIATRDIDSEFSKGILQSYSKGYSDKITSDPMFKSLRVVHLFWIIGWLDSVGKKLDIYLEPLQTLIDDGQWLK